MTSPTLASLAEEIKRCQACALATGRTNAVPGEGNPHPEIVFVGEGPGRREDESGRPFVGPAGQMLEELLASISLARADVFITNVVKCRPPENRDPEPGETDLCTSLYLEKQLQLLQPKLVVTLGRHALAYFLPETFRITAVHGKPYRRRGRVILPMYHPAAVLYNESLRATLERDFQRIPVVLTKVSRT